MQKLVPKDSILIPVQAQRVYKGALFEVYAWQQEMFDGSNRTFEMIKRPDAVDVLVIKGGQILILHEEQPHKGASTNLPSGRVEPGESWQEAAERELLEEAGLLCHDWKLVDIAQPVTKMEWFVALFVANDISEEREQNLDGGEKITLEWCDYEDIRSQVLRGDLKEMSYLIPFFSKVSTVKDLLLLQPFAGDTVDR